MRLALLALAIVALLVVGADYFGRQRPSIATVATSSGRTASHYVTDAEIAADDASTEDYWSGEAYGMAQRPMKAADCPKQNGTFRRGCAAVASGGR